MSDGLVGEQITSRKTATTIARRDAIAAATRNANSPLVIIGAEWRQFASILSKLAKELLRVQSNVSPVARRARRRKQTAGVTATGKCCE